MNRISTMLFVLFLLVPQPGHAAESQAELTLRDGWAIESSARVRAGGDVISTADFNSKEWYKTSVPNTVVSALVNNRVYQDPYIGTNLRALSGTTYPIASNFSNLPMPPDSPFRSSWWYRTDFKVPQDYSGKIIRLYFDGINFRANVWLNGKPIAFSDKMAGAWRFFEFNVTPAIKPGQVNSLAVEVFPPQVDDLAITFVDWNPLPPDKNMGIWRDVRLTAAGPVALRWPQVITKLNLPESNRAELTVNTELRNDTNEPIQGVLKGSIENITFSQKVKLEAHENREVAFEPSKFPQLKITDPKLWWPVQTGPQNLYPLNLEFVIGGEVSDKAAIRFGIREVKSFLDDKNHRRFQVNGKNILVRGAGYTFDMLLRSTPEKQEAELKYVRDMNLNSIRLEGKLENEHFMDLCDEYGIIVLAGWCCCDHWEHWKRWKEEDYGIANESLKDQIRRLRSHASVFNWMNGSDNPPPPDVERAYLNILEGYRWPNGVASSATAKPTQVTGETGVKMTGPYDYVAPSYWLLDTKRGGAHGFNTETGPGPSVPPIESLQAMLPANHLWPIDDVWNFHAGGGPFRDIRLFANAQDVRYGPSTSVEEFARKAQVMTYESHRAMFEAFGRNKYESTGVIQWMLNNAWPSVIWHLYDWYLRPGGSYFGTKKACEPLHVQYSYDDASVVVVNSTYQAMPGLKVQAKVLNLDMTEKFSKSAKIDIAEDSSTRVFTIPTIEGLSNAYFLRLDLSDASGRPLSSNLYWLSTKKEELDWDRSSWYHTPTKVFADLTSLQSLPNVELQVSNTYETKNGEGVVHVTVANSSKTIAFFVRLKADKPNGEEILPVLWQDNYFSLLPGEKRVISASYPLRVLDESGPRVDAVDGQIQGTEKSAKDYPKPIVEVSGWNISNSKPQFFPEIEN